ncbi:MAG: glycerol-3-phosphate dehydrogenase/oxidase [Bacteroidetes bacterium]|nr:MAG: glycerol-3-phosphate dehydrogenase/oxidase [Bacteroidota bacterium]
MNREAFIKELRKQTNINWDIIIIGGGATGLGIALDGTSRGYKILLLEQSDFAKGTSSRSTKLVHGGVRYMAQGDLLLVMEALHERGLLLKNAPHLTFNQEFVIPIYTGWDAIMYTVGLKFYDLLAGRLSMGKSYFINRQKTLAKLPLLQSKGLKGGVVYHDGQFDDSRLAFALAQACAERGGTVLNYFKVTGLLKDDSGKIIGVKATDIASGEEFRLKAGLVINATGVFADDVARMDNPESKPTIKPSQGVHIVLDKSFLQSSTAIMIPKTDDGRVLFAIPWYDEVVAGTTDTPLDVISLEPAAMEKEINFILQTAEKYLVKSPRREDVLCIFAGLRPLAANPDNPASTKEVSRRHRITLSPSGLLSIVGGKWTTYRRMAEETIDKAIRTGFLERKKCVTKNLKLTKLVDHSNSGRLHIYGDQSSEIEKLISEEPRSGVPIDPRLPYSKAEIIWICRNEMPLNLEDVLARRTRALFLNARASSEMAPEVAGLMAREMGYDLKWQKEQIKSYNQLVKNYI